jgi:serine phosphatase RsbU (regulator of sigma subunit)/pSer/pThr/pTyr-binding forkhead associated (FHA) protein
MSHAHLRIHDVTGSRTVVLDQPVFTIGRRSTANLPCESSDISREHATIVHEGDRHVLRDCGSRYGTYVNGDRIDEHVLVTGDRIRLGRTSALELVFEADGTSRSRLSEIASDLTDLRQLAIMMDVLRALGSGRVLDEVLALVVDAALEVSKADRGFVMLAHEHGELEFRVARARGRQALPGTSFSTSGKIPREVFATGRSQLVDDLEGRPDHPETVLIGIGHVMCVPLRVTAMGTGQQSAANGSRIIGVLYLDGRKRNPRRSSSILSSLEAFATQAALAIESARLYAEAAEKARLDRDLRVAAEIQRALLAEPAYSGAICDVAAASLPCRTIGGDFYDYLEREDGAFAFALGDVAGKGPPAALLAAAAQSHFVAQATNAGDPAQTVARINLALLRRMIEARFATMFHGVITPAGELSYCNAGHEPPVVVTDEGVTSLETGGPILGLFGDATYASASVQLRPHDRVVICSDGVTEAVNVSGEEFGRLRLLDVIQRHRSGSVEHMLERVLEALRTFSHGAPQSDDMTLLVVGYRPAHA